MDTRTHRNHRIKSFVYRYYPLICVTAFAGATAFLILDALPWQPFAIVAGGVGAFAFGVQRQNLEETRLFKDLFETFNARYRTMSDAVNRICRQPRDLPLREEEIETLFEYFNLCGEEYLYYEKGFICEEVWKAWKRGMDHFRRNPRLTAFWDNELADNESYYGLKF